MDFNYDTGTISTLLTLDPGSNALTIAGTSGLVIPSGTTAQRVDTASIIRFNTDNSTIEGFNGASWMTLQNVNANLSALSALSGLGFITQTGTNTFAERLIVGTTNNITVTNGDGAAGNPTINLATAGTAGTYVSVTTDSFGRVTSGSTTQAFSTLTGLPITLSGYGITNAVTNAGGIPSMSGGVFASRPAAGTLGRLYVSTDTSTLYYDSGLAWGVIQPAMSGDATSTAGGTVLTLSTVNSNVGIFGSATQIPVLTVNAKGLITAVSTASISGNITLSGDITGSGSTGGTVSTTLATVNSNVGQYGTAAIVPQITVNAKGLVTAVANVTITPAAIGAVATSALGANGGVATLGLDGTLTPSQIPPALVGALVYQGVWNATTNTPTITSSVGTKGQYYKVSVAGTTTIDGENKWAVGDIIVFNGTTWDGIDGLTSEVTSVFGRVGAVTATLASSDFANQGTTITVLHGNASGNPSWGAINLGTDVTGTLLAAQHPALTGDVTTSAGSLSTTLATVNSNVGLFGSGTQVPQFTVNAKGLITAVSNVTIPSSLTFTNDVTGTGTVGSSTALTLATVNSNVGQFGSTTAIPVLTVNAKGLITAVSTVAISGNIAITGDATGTGTTGSNTAITFNTVNSNVGQFGSATQVPQFTVNAKGLITAAANITINASSTGSVANAGNSPSLASGLLSARPAAGTVGALYVASDTNTIYRDNGTIWTVVGESIVLYTENPSSPVTNTASGANAIALGSGNTASGAHTFATGSGSSSAIYGAEVRANGSFTTAGDAQSGKYILRNITTTATQTEVFLDGSAARIVLPNNSAMTFQAQVVARRTDAVGTAAAWNITGLAVRDTNAASTSLIGTRGKTVLTRQNSNLDVDVYADTTAGTLSFKVTGVASQTYRWVVTVTTTEVAN